MSYTIVSATYATPDNSAAIINTDEAGDVAVSQADTPELWAQMLQGAVGPYAPPPAPVPGSVTMRQARLALNAIGKLASVDAAIAAMVDPQKTEAQIEWQYSSTVERDKPLVLQLGPALGLTDADLDNLFFTAAGL